MKQLAMALLIALMTCAAALAQTGTTVDYYSQVSTVANFAALPVCSAALSAKHERIVEDTDEKYNCRDPGGGFAWTLVSTASGTGNVVGALVDGEIVVGAGGADVESFSNLTFNGTTLTTLNLDISGTTLLGEVDLGTPVSDAVLTIAGGTSDFALVRFSAGSQDIGQRGAFLKAFNNGGGFIIIGARNLGVDANTLQVSSTGIGILVKPAPGVYFTTKDFTASTIAQLRLENGSIGDIGINYVSPDNTFVCGLDSSTGLWGCSYSSTPGGAVLGTDNALTISSAGDGVFAGTITANGCTDFESVTADPVSPNDCDKWYNSTDNQFRGRAGGVTVDLH